jgi:hypothetical protein
MRGATILGQNLKATHHINFNEGMCASLLQIYIGRSHYWQSIGWGLPQVWSMFEFLVKCAELLTWRKMICNMKKIINELLFFLNDDVTLLLKIIIFLKFQSWLFLAVLLWKDGVNRTRNFFIKFRKRVDLKNHS